MYLKSASPTVFECPSPESTQSGASPANQ
jgi:hypothetical protein